jgi:hypothetical protein
MMMMGQMMMGTTHPHRKLVPQKRMLGKGKGSKKHSKKKSWMYDDDGDDPERKLVPQKRMLGKGKGSMKHHSKKKGETSDERE